MVDQKMALFDASRMIQPGQICVCVSTGYTRLGERFCRNHVIVKDRHEHSLFQHRMKWNTENEQAAIAAHLMQETGLKRVIVHSHFGSNLSPFGDYFVPRLFIHNNVDIEQRHKIAKLQTLLQTQKSDHKDAYRLGTVVEEFPCYISHDFVSTWFDLFDSLDAPLQTIYWCPSKQAQPYLYNLRYLVDWVVGTSTAIEQLFDLSMSTQEFIAYCPATQQRYVWRPSLTLPISFGSKDFQAMVEKEG